MSEQAEGYAGEQGAVDPVLLAELRDGLADTLAFTWDRLAQHLARYFASVQKAADDQPDSDSIDDALQTFSWQDTAQAIQSNDSVIQPLVLSFLAGVGGAEVQIGITWGLKNPAAIAYARARAAEMVGMRRLNDGRLVPNPNAKWAIADTTRDELRALIARTFENYGVSYRELKQQIEQQPGFDSLFGEYRAEMIARSELAMSQNIGTCDTYGQADVTQVDVLDNVTCKICGPVAGTRQTLAWARENPIGHPHCIRKFNAVLPSR